MKFKVIIVSLIMSVLTCNLVYGQLRSPEHLKEFKHLSLYLGTYSSGVGGEGYSAGLIVSYSRNKQKYWSPRFFGDLGLFLSIAYFSDPEEDGSFIAQWSKGFWLNETWQINFALGPVYSIHNGYGGTGTVWVGIDNLSPFASGVIFLQSDRYRNSKVSSTKWRYTLGVSLAI